jgi:hypothetical protein
MSIKNLNKKAKPTGICGYIKQSIRGECFYQGIISFPPFIASLWSPYYTEDCYEGEWQLSILP